MKTYLENCNYDCPHCIELRNCDWAFYNIEEQKKVSEKSKNNIITWINFGITIVGIIAKVVKEIVENIPNKEN